MNSQIPNKYIITYSNWFEFKGQILAFRKGELFNINNIPQWIPFNEMAQGWIVNRAHLSKSKAKELIKMEPKEVDISGLAWYTQEELNHVFNLV